ncbi:MAG: M15 family metallopeptidase [Pseudohongiellaceae bacterium]
MHEKNDSTIRDSITTVSRIHLELGIPVGYRVSCGMNLQEECTNLVNTELDVFGRQPQLEVATFAAWQTMQAAAIKDDIVLQIISAYRSFDYQKQMFIRKMARGDSLSAILQVNAAPGYSEHHSGRAVDIGCPGYPFLEVNFETSPAFAWLSVCAEKFGFHMSFPKENPFGVCYEPWHWCFIKQD